MKYDLNQNTCKKGETIRMHLHAFIKKNTTYLHHTNIHNSQFLTSSGPQKYFWMECDKID